MNRTAYIDLAVFLLLIPYLILLAGGVIPFTAATVAGAILLTKFELKLTWTWSR